MLSAGAHKYRQLPSESSISRGRRVFEVPFTANLIRVTSRVCDGSAPSLGSAWSLWHSWVGVRLSARTNNMFVYSALRVHTYYWWLSFYSLTSTVLSLATKSFYKQYGEMPVCSDRTWLEPDWVDGLSTCPIYVTGLKAGSTIVPLLCHLLNIKPVRRHYITPRCSSSYTSMLPIRSARKHVYQLREPPRTHPQSIHQDFSFLCLISSFSPPHPFLLHILFVWSSLKRAT